MKANKDGDDSAIKAEFSANMATMLFELFDVYQSNGIVTIEVTDTGLWFLPETGEREFLGSTQIITNCPLIQ